MHGAAMLAQGIQASAGNGRRSAIHSWAGGAVLLGQVEDADRNECLPLVISGNRIQERAASGGTNVYWYVGHPTPMGTLRYRATVTVGNQSAGTNRGALVFVGGKDASGNPALDNLVWFRIRGQAGFAAVIATKTGLGAAGVVTSRVSAANTVVAAGDTIGLEVEETAPGSGIFRYTGLKNDVPVSGAVWDDTTNIFGVPGKMWGGGGYGTYSGSYFPSLGVYAIAATDL